jgi:hypothetical protein
MQNWKMKTASWTGLKRGNFGKPYLLQTASWKTFWGDYASKVVGQEQIKVY